LDKFLDLLIKDESNNLLKSKKAPLEQKGMLCIIKEVRSRIFDAKVNGNITSGIKVLAGVKTVKLVLSTSGRAAIVPMG